VIQWPAYSAVHSLCGVGGPTCWLRSSTPPRLSTSASCRSRTQRETARRRHLSPAIAAQLRDAGYDAVHVIDVDLATAVDPAIVDYAESNGLAIITVDTDFPMLIALRRATTPSILLLRGVNELPPEQHAALIIANLPAIADDLKTGAIVSLSPEHLRVRTLPLN